MEISSGMPCTTPDDIMHRLSIRHRSLGALFRRIRAKSSALNRFGWHYAFENNEWLQLNDCLAPFISARFEYFPRRISIWPSYRFVRGTMPMDILQPDVLRIEKRERMETGNNRRRRSEGDEYYLSRIIHFALIFLLAGDSHWNRELLERA